MKIAISYGLCMYCIINVFWCCIIVNLTMADEDMVKLGRAFASLGCKPEYTASEIDSWMLAIAKQTEEATVKTEPQSDVIKDASGKNKASGDKDSFNLVSINPRRLPIFSGDDSNASKEVRFAQWKFEVKCLHRDPTQSEQLVLQSIRSSVKGTAADVLLHLGEDVKIGDILEKFEVVFGDVLGSEQLLESFYSAKQDAKESVALWGCRLEDLLDKAKKRGSISADDSSSMLRSKFWSGITDPSLKSALRHHYDGGVLYDDLFRYARVIETELTPNQKAKCHQIADSGPSKESQLDTIMSELQKMNDRMSQLENRRSRSNRRCYGCGSEEHLIKFCPNKASKNE